MSQTTTVVPTTGAVLDQANPNTLPSAIQELALGSKMTSKVYDTGTITATAAITVADLVTAHYANLSPAQKPPANSPAVLLALRTLRVVTSGTATSVGSYALTDSSGTALVPPGGASAAVGLAKLSDDGKTITFPNTVTRIVASFWAAVDVTANFGEDV